jgi:nuclear GTP-binding protein
MARSLSKRLSLSRKYSITKKVKDHEKKLKRASKKAKSSGLLASKKTAADPGIPKNWPFKQEMLMEIEQQHQQRALEMKDRKKLGLPKLLSKKVVTKDTVVKSVTDLMREAEAKNGGYDFMVDGDYEGMEIDEAGMPSISNDMEKTRKRFMKDLRHVVSSADVVLFVLDARDPEACRDHQLEKEISGQGKRVILVLNKIDLVPEQAVSAWISKLRQEYPTIPFKASRGSTAKRITATASKSASEQQAFLNASQSVFGADVLMKLLKTYSLQNSVTASLSVGIIGFPNTGKSSIINSLLAINNKKIQVKTGNQAGVTTEHQSVQLDGKITLIDSPGVVLGSGEKNNAASLVIRRAVNVSSIEDPVGVVCSLVERVPRDLLAQEFRLPLFENADDFLIQLGKAHGKIKRGGVIDKEATARYALHCWSNGKVKFFVMPEIVRQNTAVVVTERKEAMDLLDDLDLTEACARKDEPGLMVVG